jgi:hypothetical protein
VGGSHWLGGQSIVNAMSLTSSPPPRRLSADYWRERRSVRALIASGDAPCASR